MNFDTCIKLQLEGQLTNAELCYKKLLKNKKISKTTIANIYCNLGIICFATKREGEAITFFKDTINLNPHSYIAYNNLGLILSRNKKYDEAERNFFLALKYKHHPKTYFNLALTYENTGKINKALKNYEKAIEIKNDYSEAFCNLGNLHYLCGNLLEAKKNIKKSIKLNPNLDASFNNLGLIEMASGNFKSAKKYFTKTIKINPDNAKAHYNLSTVINYDVNGKIHFKQMIQNIKLTRFNENIMHYSFALGKAYEDKKNYSLSFQYFKKGNMIKRKSFAYSIKQDQNLFKTIKERFNKNTISHFNDLGFCDNTPIFIIGMPRSGTSLIEQILASHPDVHGAGEINDLDNIILNYFCEKGDFKLLKKLNDLDKNIFNLTGKKYCLQLKQRSQKAKYITNKLTLNFRWIGLIKLILPKAKIIHCKRNAIDTSLSIFQKIFPVNGNEYTYDIIEIAKYYQIYLNIMNHWKNLIPDSFFEIKYEELIDNQKTQTKKLLQYCNLSWNEACLNFFRTRRMVRTSSNKQVRHEIYKSSIDRWKIYKKELNEIRKLLD